MSAQSRVLELASGLRAGMLLLSEVDEAAELLERLVAENEAKDALLRQALAAIVWECGSESSFYAEKTRTTIAAIRQHLEGKA